VDNELFKRLTARIQTDYEAGDLPLPSFPEVAVRIREAVADADKGVGEVARLVQLDPAIAAGVMQAANSALFSGMAPAPSCQAAVARLGLNGVRDVVTALALRNTFHTASPELAVRMKRLWAHSVQVAALSRVLASVGPDFDPDRALLAGLVHDIGLLPLFGYAEAFPELATQPALFDGLAARLRGRLGALTLRQWGFDAGLQRVALEAEEWERDPNPLPDYVDVVLLANIFSTFESKESYGGPPFTTLPAFSKFPLGALGPEGAVELLETAQEEIAAVVKLLA